LLLDRAVATGEPFDAEYRFRRKDGAYIIVQDNGIFLKDDQGRWSRMLGTMSDITERRKSEDLILRVARSIAHTGQSFLSSLVTELARALDVEYAFVAEIKKDSPSTMETVAVLANGQIRHGQLSGSIHEVGRAIQGAPCNGWEHWYYLDAGADERRAIDRLREIVRAENGQQQGGNDD